MPDFLCSTQLLDKILSTNLVACKPAFYTFYTFILLYFYYKALFAYRTNLGELSFALFKPIISVFHNFARQIAVIQYSRRSTRFPCTINYRIDHITERFHEENSKNVGTVQSDQSAPVQYAGQ